MSQGYLKIILRTANQALPIQNENVYVKIQKPSLEQGSQTSGNAVDQTYYDYRLITNSSGETTAIVVETPDKSISLNEYSDELPYALASVYTDVAGYYPVRITGIQIFPGEISDLPIELTPISMDYNAVQRGIIQYDIPPSVLLTTTEKLQDTNQVPVEPFVQSSVVIPESISVHLGTPSSNARNVYVPFVDYIKNVASSEIYPTWNEEALRANILAIISLTLNRIYTEWYPSQGYDFDITSSTAYDQSFVPGRNIFENISKIVDEIFNNYIVREGFENPLFASYCDGIQVNCAGLKQWGTETLAQQGNTAINILKNYYGDDILIETAEQIDGNISSYPGYPLMLGSQGPEVEFIRRQLFRISENYPLIPRINPLLTTFDSSLDTAVRTFQEIFGLTVDGIVGKATWYRISYIYSSVLKLAELSGAGEAGDIPENPPEVELGVGDTGNDVALLQIMLGYIGLFYDSISSPALDGAFGSNTERAVREFQQYFGLDVTGRVTASDWEKLYEVYNNVLVAVTPDAGAQSYPGNPLSIGSRGENVRLMQEYLNAILYDNQPQQGLTVDGIYGQATANAVRAFQSRYYLPQTGVIDDSTWFQIVEAYNFITRQGI